MYMIRIESHCPFVPIHPNVSKYQIPRISNNEFGHGKQNVLKDKSLHSRPINSFQIYYLNIMSNFVFIFTNMFWKLFCVERFFSQESLCW